MDDILKRMLAVEKEADKIVLRSKEEAEQILEESRQKANEIATQTQLKCREMRKGAQDFVDDLLKRTEEDLAKHASEVHQMRQMLRKPAAREE